MSNAYFLLQNLDNVHKVDHLKRNINVLCSVYFQEIVCEKLNDTHCHGAFSEMTRQRSEKLIVL